MAEIKDKVVTVESLSILHEHNRNTYMPTVDPIGSGTMTINGNGNFSGDVNASSLTINSEVQLVPMGNGLKFVFGSDSNDMVAETYVNATSLSAIHYWTKTSSTGSSSSIVVSADSSAFPKNGEQDGFTYVYQGTLDSVSAEPVIRSITITGNGTYTAPSGVDGYSPVTVNVSSSETSAPTITVDSSGLIRATAGTEYTTKKLSVSDDSDFKAENIKNGVNIFGITGNFVDGGYFSGNVVKAYETSVIIASGTGSIYVTHYDGVKNDNGTVVGSGLANSTRIDSVDDFDEKKEKYIKVASGEIYYLPEDAVVMDTGSSSLKEYTADKANKMFVLA